MTTFKLPAQEEKSDYVLRQFDRIAKRYDLTNDVISFGMHRLWKLAAVNKLDLKPQGRYLDVCTGTGDLAMLIASRPNFAGEVTGLDFSPEMLLVAQSREIGRTLASKPAWIKGDAENLPFDDQSFDGAIISFGLRNLCDLPRGLAEMARVVKPGGKVINLDLGQPRTPLFTPLFFFFFDHVVPLIGEIVQGDKQAYTYLPESRKTYPGPEALSRMLADAGLQNIQYQPLAFGSVALHVGTV